MYSYVYCIVVLLYILLLLHGDVKYIFLNFFMWFWCLDCKHIYVGLLRMYGRNKMVVSGRSRIWKKEGSCDLYDAITIRTYIY